MRRIFLNLFDSSAGTTNRLISRWLFLRALGLIYFSAFLALIFQVRGLIGTQGILPAADYLHGGLGLGLLRFWYVPTLLWFSSTDAMLMTICWAGLFASILIQLWPIASTSAFTSMPMGGWFFLLLGWGLAEAQHGATA